MIGDAPIGEPQLLSCVRLIWAFRGDRFVHIHTQTRPIGRRESFFVGDRATKEGVVISARSNAVPWDLDIQKATVRLREPVSKVHKMEFPARPMLGCVGVGAAADFGPSSGISGAYGGNMDYNEVVEGATVVLPVYHASALLFMGDGHALQADGEPTGTGIETSMDVEFTVAVRKNANLSNPRLETTDHIISVGSQPEFASPLDRALQLATTDMVEWLAKDYGMEPWPPTCWSAIRASMMSLPWLVQSACAFRVQSYRRDEPWLSNSSPLRRGNRFAGP